MTRRESDYPRKKASASAIRRCNRQVALLIDSGEDAISSALSSNATANRRLSLIGKGSTSCVLRSARQAMAVLCL